MKVLSHFEGNDAYFLSSKCKNFTLDKVKLVPQIKGKLTYFKNIVLSVIFFVVWKVCGKIEFDLLLELERVWICPVIIPLHIKRWLVHRYIPRSSTKDVIWFNNNSEMFRKWVFLPWKNKAILGAMVISDQTPSCG